jgi:hypothetical protein
MRIPVEQILDQACREYQHQFLSFALTSLAVVLVFFAAMLVLDLAEPVLRPVPMHLQRETHPLQPLSLFQFQQHFQSSLLLPLRDFETNPEQMRLAVLLEI